MVRQHHPLSGLEFKQTPGDSEGEGSLACFSPWGHKESDKCQFLSLCLLYGPALTTIHDHQEDHSLDYIDLCQQSKVSAFQSNCLGLAQLSCKKQSSPDFMAEVTICSDFRAKVRKSVTTFHFSPICCEVMGPDLSFSNIQFTASDLASITSHIHNWVLFLLWLQPFILSGVISPLISSSILGYQPGEFIFQCPIFLPFHTVYAVLKARILKW